MLKVKSAVFDCTASSDTATFRTVGEDSITTASGIVTDLPFIVFQTFAASSDLPLARTNSLSLIASFGKSASAVEVTRSWAMSSAFGAGLMLKLAGGSSLDCTDDRTASYPSSTN